MNEAAATKTEPRPPRPRWRRVLRGCRIAVLLGVFAAAAALCWVQFLGVPEVVKARVFAELRAQGLEAGVASLRFSLRDGLLARGLRVVLGAGTNAPVLRIPEARLRLRPPPWRGDLGLLRALEIRDGELVQPLPAAGRAAARALVFRHVVAEVAFHPGDVVQVDRCAAEVLGVRLEFSGVITNAVQLTRRRAGAPPDAARRARMLAELRDALEAFDSWRVTGTPYLTVFVRGDAARPEDAAAELLFAVPEADTPRGYVRGLRLALRFPPGGPVEGVRQARLMLDVAEARSGDGGVEALRIEGGLLAGSALEVPTNAAWQVTAGHLHARGLRARSLTLRATNHLAAALPPLELLRRRDVPTDFTLTAGAVEAGEWLGEPVRAAGLRLEGRLGRLGTNLVPAEAALRGELRGLRTATGSVARVELDAAWRPAAGPGASAPELAFWNILRPFAGRVSLALEDAASPAFTARRLELATAWDGRRLEVSRLTGELYRGRLDLRGTLDVESRVAEAAVAISFDLHGLDPLLGPAGRANFGRFQWRDPPEFTGSASLRFPAWTNRAVRWQRDFEPNLRFSGRVRTGPASFKGMPVDSVRSSLDFDAGRWRLPDLESTRPEGAQAVDIDYDKPSGQYRIAGRGRVLPPVLKPVLGEASSTVLDLFSFPEGVEADVVVFGPWTEGNRMGIAGTIAATNLAFRGERFDALSVGAVYTNRLMVLTNVAARRDGAALTAGTAAYHFDEDRVWLTNVVSALEPSLVAGLISPEFPEKIRHYRFGRPPRIVADGTFARRNLDDGDLRFGVAGEDFTFWRLHARNINADLRWAGGRLALTNLNASFYEGVLDGWAEFEVGGRAADTPYRFAALVRGARLGPLMRDAATTNSRLEGELELDLHVTSGLTSDVMTWNGHGRASLTNGLIWDVPVFGFMSPALNTLMPGLGSQRFDRATADFTITDGVIRTTNLLMNSALVRLDYRGTVDLERRVDTRVEARVFRNVSLLGPLFSVLTAPITKLFEFKVTGTLADPEPQPVYVPKFLFWPFQALGWIASGFRGPAEDGSGDALGNLVTNAPPDEPPRREP
ncbi:MAG: AsmA-like C-terminal region-containing protein [Limisphaerales bacterium]